MSGLFGSITVPGNRLTDIAQQTSAVGQPIPFGYGRFLVDGNIIWTAGKPTEHVKKKQQGKGGVKTEEYTYTLSYAIAFCAGPIFGYFTILRDGKVVYTTDPNAAIEDKDFAVKWAQKCMMYFGTRTQMPDSTIEAKEGAGKVSAFRDLAYIVVEDDDVTGNAGAVPQYAAVVVASPPEVYVTSQPYALESGDDILVGQAQARPGGLYQFGNDFAQVDPIIALDGEIREVIQTLVLKPQDFVQVGKAVALDGSIKQTIKTLVLKPEDFVQVNTASAYDGVLKETVKTYAQWPVEPVTVNQITPLNGTLT